MTARNTSEADDVAVDSVNGTPPGFHNGEVASTVSGALSLADVGNDVFIAGPASADDPRGLYGGRLTAQSLRAASLTLPDNRLAHSMHCYFLVPGDATKPITFTVTRERDGGRYSVRRVVASQDGVDILHLAASFQREQPGADYQAQDMPATVAPTELTSVPQDPRMLDLDVRIPDDGDQYHRWPTRLWIRITEPLDTDPNNPDPNLRACGLVFISDMCTGLSKAPMVKHVGILPSIDHTVWVHRPCDPNQWMLMDLAPESTSSGRGMYTGRIYNEDEVLLASLAQESLFRNREKRNGSHTAGRNGHAS
ncbi:MULTISPECIES: acyl-CoA thioesterase [Gordonia]|uniref:Thioesterase family protein n=1 Tax=Gordonia amicalis TaxID=89053 RepID=A0ABU4DDL4_9ACTN|nr:MULTISPECIES: acyl-CoA thioesterase domain-containing protein [Gordonia]ATD72299.1 acyl-CoA thioesterase II [Gordonia sp. 1D]MCR8895999.1 thioesterase family protein [Gordonia sp. GONU]MCZ4651556.1 thioesterase family protein [Gordonia amicalis]MDJ0452589.1 thioesterase family protein [Gordonia amicalis]MDV6307837.1 thioesterase family protein [Gordonia amicalis]